MRLAGPTNLTESSDAVAASPSQEGARRNVGRCWWIPLGLGVAGCVASLIVGGLSMVAVACGIVLLVAGAVGGGFMARAQSTEVTIAVMAARLPEADLRAITTQTIPVWQRQIETSSGEGDAAVTELTRVFSGIVEKLEKVLATVNFSDSSAEDQHDGVMEAVARSGADLDGLVDALRQLQESREHMVREIGEQAARLKENAAEVRGIAMQTRILTLNAAIEAARAGAAGAPFAVIVGDMRQLAARTADTSEKISKQTDVLNASVESAFKESVESTSSGASIERAQNVIRSVVGSFQLMTESLGNAIDSMEKERGEVRDEISSALVSLQFQDRVSQILSHVSHGMQTLNTRLANGDYPSESEIQDWLEEMSSAYTTREEFENLTAGEQVRLAPDGSKEITYF